MGNPTTEETNTTNGEYIAHCIIVPLPFQGHINPIFQFAKRLSTHRLRLTFALTKFCLNSIQHLPPLLLEGPPIAIRSISDGFDEGGRAQASSSEDYQARFQQAGTACQQVGRQTLTDLLQDLSESGRPVDCVVYDPFLPWVLDVGKELGLCAAAFFTQSCAVDSIYPRVSSGQLKLPLQGGDRLVIPGLPPVIPEELPSFIYDYGSYPATFRILLNQFRNIDKADWIFINTFDKLEEQDDPISRGENVSKGLVVSWCPQLKVLAHDAVGCFVTHCGWNSTLEGLSMGVPMVAMPQWTDQSTNAKFVEEIWRVGVRARADDNGLVREGEIVGCIKHVMEEEEIRRNACKWKEMAREAVDEGGTSDKNIVEFVVHWQLPVRLRRSHTHIRQGVSTI